MKKLLLFLMILCIKSASCQKMKVNYTFSENFTSYFFQKEFIKKTHQELIQQAELAVESVQRGIEACKQLSMEYSMNDITACLELKKLCPERFTFDPESASVPELIKKDASTLSNGDLVMQAIYSDLLANNARKNTWPFREISIRACQELEKRYIPDWNDIAIASCVRLKQQYPEKFNK